MMHRILIVEENPDLAFGLRNNLEIEGYDIAVAEDGLAGLRAVRATHPDVIIGELMMRGLEGERVVRALSCNSLKRTFGARRRVDSRRHRSERPQGN
jgi:two-component system OmpR family response regulator